jgi:hypothetical protein
VIDSRDIWLTVVYLYIYKCLCDFVCVCLFLCLCMYLCVYMYACDAAEVFMNRMFIHVNACVCERFGYTCVFLGVFVCASVYIHAVVIGSIWCVSGCLCACFYIDTVVVGSIWCVSGCLCACVFLY